MKKELDKYKNRKDKNIYYHNILSLEWLFMS